MQNEIDTKNLNQQFIAYIDVLLLILNVQIIKWNCNLRVAFPNFPLLLLHA